MVWDVLYLSQHQSTTSQSANGIAGQSISHVKKGPSDFKARYRNKTWKSGIHQVLIMFTILETHETMFGFLNPTYCSFSILPSLDCPGISSNPKWWEKSSDGISFYFSCDFNLALASTDFFWINVVHRPQKRCKGGKQSFHHFVL